MKSATSSFTMRMDSSLIKKLDKEAELHKMSRTELIQYIVSIYFSAKDDFVTQCLPSIVRSMIKSEIDNLVDTSKEIVKDIYVSAIKMRRVTEKLDTFLAPEFEKAEYDQMKTDELLHLIDKAEKDDND